MNVLNSLKDKLKAETEADDIVAEISTRMSIELYERITDDVEKMYTGAKIPKKYGGNVFFRVVAKLATLILISGCKHVERKDRKKFARKFCIIMHRYLLVGLEATENKK